MKKAHGWSRILCIAVVAVICFSCASRNATRKIEKLPCKDIIDLAEKPSEFPEVFAARYQCEVVLPDGSNQKFTATIRSHKNRIATISIAPLLGIELFRVNLYQDSVIFLDKLNKQFYTGRYQYLSEQLGTDISLDLLQDLLSSIPLKYADSERYKCDRTNDAYVIKNVPSRKLRKALGLGRDEEYDSEIDSLYVPEKPRKLAKAIRKDDDIFVKRYFFDGDFQLRRVLIHEVEHQRILDISYGIAELISGVKAAKEINLLVSDPEQSMGISLKLSRIKVSDEIDEEINIPEKYERIVW